MNIFLKIIKQIVLLPYTILNTIFSKFTRKNADTQTAVSNEPPSIKYFISLLVWVMVGYLFFKNELKQNRIVYACPGSFGARCYNVEAEYESTCSKEGNCMYYYTKIYLPGRKTVEFSYCEDKGIASQTCYAKNTNEAWNLDYLGKNVIKK